MIASTDNPELLARDSADWLFAFGGAASIRAALGGGWDGIAGAELGYVPGGITFVATGSRVLSLAGVTLAVSIGAGRRF